MQGVWKVGIKEFVLKKFTMTMLLSIAAQIMVIAVIMLIGLLFIGVGFMVVIHVCIVGRACRRGLRMMTGMDRCSDVNSGLSLDELEKLPWYEFGAAEKEGGTVDCVVCLESFQLGERCRLLPGCKHSFHAHCVDYWLMSTPICPICRTSAENRKGDKGIREQETSFGGQVEFGFRESRTITIGFPMGADPSAFQASASQ